MRIYRRTDSKYWWVEGYDADGARFRISTKQKSKRQAEKVGKAIQRERISKALADEPITLEEMYRLSRIDQKNRELSPETISSNEANARQLLAFYGEDFDVTKITTADVERYVFHCRKNGLKMTTILRRITGLLRGLKVLKRHDLFTREISGLRPDVLKNVSQPRTTYLTTDEITRLLNVAAHNASTRKRPPAPNRPWHDYLLVYLYTGIRRGEIETATISSSHIIVTNHKTMRRRHDKRAQRIVPIHPAIATLMKENPLPWPTPMDLRGLHRITTEAGVKHFTLTDLRRTFCSMLAMAGVPELHMCELMGHTDSTMIRNVYAQINEKTLLTAIENLPNLLDG